MERRPWSGEDYVQANPSHPAVYISWDDVQEVCWSFERRGGRFVVSVAYGGGVGVCVSSGEVRLVGLLGTTRAT